MTIGQLAKHVGVTVKAVRHYHRLGLLPEPDRDSSDYRRYGAQAVIELTRIKVLRDAGVPLRGIPDLLRADAATLVDAAEQLAQDLDTQIEVLQRRKERIRLLTAGERLYLPAEVVDLLDHLRSLGLPESVLELEHDGWVIWSASAPADVARWARLKQQRLADPAVLADYLDSAHVLTWEPDDPRLAELASRIGARVDLGLIDYRRLESENEATQVLMDDQFAQTAPALIRLQELVREHIRARIIAEGCGLS
ncbi:MAG: MerR family transcriptional regulator [Trebonia sp.]